MTAAKKIPAPLNPSPAGTVQFQKADLPPDAFRRADSSNALGDVIDGAEAVRQLGALLKDYFIDPADTTLEEEECTARAFGYALESVGMRLEDAAGNMVTVKILNK